MASAGIVSTSSIPSDSSTTAQRPYFTSSSVHDSWFWGARLLRSLPQPCGCSSYDAASRIATRTSETTQQQIHFFRRGQPEVIHHIPGGPEFEPARKGSLATPSAASIEPAHAEDSSPTSRTVWQVKQKLFNTLSVILNFVVCLKFSCSNQNF